MVGRSGRMPRGVPKSGKRAPRKTAGEDHTLKKLTCDIGSKKALLSYHKKKSHVDQKLIADLEKEIIDLETERKQHKEDL